MQYVKYIEKDFEQNGPVCVLASYANVIVAFSQGRYTVKDILSKYNDFYKIVSNSEKIELSKKGAKIFRTVFQEKIGNAFNKYCTDNGGLRGYDFIKYIHDNNLLNTNSHCKIIDYKAQTTPIPLSDLNTLKTKLSTLDCLCIVTYPSGNANCHSVLTGYDPTNSLFVKDSEKNDFDSRDFLSTPIITEYILFEK